jgi:hypothetical protein
LLKFPDGEIATDGKFIWVNYMETCIMRLRLKDVDANLVDVKTYFKFGFIDGTVGPKGTEDV